MGDAASDPLALLLPGTTATRWLLLVDAACLLAIGLATRRRSLGIPLALAAGGMAINSLGMVFDDFYVGLALFHLGTAAAAASVLRRGRRWLALGAFATAVTLGILT